MGRRRTFHRRRPLLSTEPPIRIFRIPARLHAGLVKPPVVADRADRRPAEAVVPTAAVRANGATASTADRRRRVPVPRLLHADVFVLTELLRGRRCVRVTACSASVHSAWRSTHPRRRKLLRPTASKEFHQVRASSTLFPTIIPPPLTWFSPWPWALGPAQFAGPSRVIIIRNEYLIRVPPGAVAPKS